MTAPQIAHLLLVHKSPQQVSRLVRQLVVHPAASVFIHVDAKSDILPFIHEMSGINRVYFLKRRIEVNWAGFSMIEASLRLLRVANKSGQFDFYNFLSGEDYPLKSATEIHHFLGENRGKSFVEFLQNGDLWWEQARQRFTRYYLTDFKLPGKYTLERWINSLFPDRKPLRGFQLVGKSQWMTLYRDHVDFILNRAVHSVKIMRFFRYSWAPDEFFFQTLLFNSKYRSHLVNNNLRYILWEEGKASPETMTTAQLPALRKTDKLFARKFDEHAYPEILTHIDDWLSNMDFDFQESNQPLK